MSTLKVGEIKHESFTGTTQLKLDSAGRVLIGTSTDNGFKFKVSDGGGYEFAFAPNDSGVNSLINYNRSGGAYVPFMVSGSDLRFGSGGNSERMRIDSSGNVLVGLTSTLSSNNAKLQVAHTDGNADIIVHRAGNNANPPGLNFQKTRNASIGNYGTIVQDDDELGSIRWGGADGSAIAFAARIVGAVDGTPGANDMPGRIQFHTSADGSEGMTERMRIDSSGNVGIGTSSPSAKLHLFGAASDFEGLRLTNNLRNDSAASSAQIKFDIRNSGGLRTARIEAREKNDNNNECELNFYTNSSASQNGEEERMTISGTGDVGIGTSTTNRGSHSKTLTVSNTGTGARSAVEIEGNTANAHGVLEFYNNGTLVSGLNSRGSDRLQFVTGSSGAVRGQFTSNGLNFGSDTAAANALSDYEEGTFEPHYLHGGSESSVNYSSRQGIYTKIGRMVTVNIAIELSNKGNTNGQITFGNLPFTVGNLLTNTAHQASGAIGYMANMNDSIYSMTVSAQRNTTQLYLMGQISHDTAFNHIDNTSITNNFTVRASCTYFTT